MEDPNTTPPLVLPEGGSSSLDSPDVSEHLDQPEVDKHSHFENYDIGDEPHLPAPPTEGSFPELDEDGRHVSDDQFGDHAPETKRLTMTEEELPRFTDEQNTGYYFVEHSAVDDENGYKEVKKGQEYHTEQEQPLTENGHNSEESCGSFQIIKHEPEEEPVLPQVPRDSHLEGEEEHDPNEPPSYEEIQCDFVKETTDNNSNSHVTQPVESHSPSELSYQSEPQNEHVFHHHEQPHISLDAEPQKEHMLDFDSSVQLNNIDPHDVSMSTTVGVSDLTSDVNCQEPTSQQSPYYEEATISTGLEHGYRNSFEEGSSYHDDVPLEETGDIQAKEDVFHENDIMEGHIPRAHEQSHQATVMENKTDVRLTETPPEEIVVGIVDETPRPSFQEICADLDRKNVVSHLQQCSSGQFVMPHHPQAGNLRQEDIVVLNPQTGEVLGSKPQSVQRITLMSNEQAPKVDIVHTSAGDGTNGTPQQPVNSGENASGRGSQSYGYQMQQDAGAGGSTPRSGGNGGNSSGAAPTSNGPTERAKQVYNMAECQLAQLTVFLDRALVCRRIRPRFNASEITEVLFEHLSPAIDKDSVRVEIRGAATILDVTYVARSLGTEEDTWTHAINELNAELRQCHRQAESLSSRLARASKQRMVLDTFADNLIRKDEENPLGSNAAPAGSVANHVGGPPSVSPSHGAPSPILGAENKGSLEVVNPYDPRNMDTLHRFLSMYEEQAERLDATLLDTSEELDQVNARIEAIEKELHEIELKQDERLARELSVLVEPRETGQVEMLISYVVGKCSWKPAYDIRIFNSDGTMKIVYYGMVQQATGENWETRSMVLSTTLPGTGGTVPPLGLQRVHFKKDHSPANPVKQPVASVVSQLPPPASGYGTITSRTRPSSKVSGFRKSARPTTTSFHEADRILNDIEQRESSTPSGTLQRGHSTEIGPSPATARHPVGRMHSRRALGTSMLFHAPSSPVPLYPSRNNGTQLNVTNTPTPFTAVSNVPTVHLEVPRPPGFIRCDNQPVRVTVGLLDLQPRYEYVTVPKRSLHAYLKATAVNRSDFSILAGETNIYADNTFIGKSEIPAVAQGEEFSCNLGAEQGIKVFYRPLFKYREGTGSNSKHATLTFKQLIEVRNTFDRPIRLMVMDQVPLSCEDKIKINLLEPVIKHPEKYDRNKPIRMNKSNNVEWDLDLGPGETKELTLKYSIEHPVNEDLDVSVSEN